MNLNVEYWRKMQRMCGTWCIARHMDKQGFTFEQVMYVLTGRIL